MQILFVYLKQVKHILDQGRCKTLQEGDILVRIAGKEVRDMDHLLVVDVLKSCLIGHPTEIVVQRGGKRFIHCHLFSHSPYLVSLEQVPCEVCCCDCPFCLETTHGIIHLYEEKYGYTSTR